MQTSLLAQLCSRAFAAQRTCAVAKRNHYPGHKYVNRHCQLCILTPVSSAIAINIYCCLKFRTYKWVTQQPMPQRTAAGYITIQIFHTTMRQRCINLCTHAYCNGAFLYACVWQCILQLHFFICMCRHMHIAIAFFYMHV